MVPSNHLTRSLLLAISFLFGSLSAVASLNANFTYQQSCDGHVTFTASQQTYSYYTWQFGDNTIDSGTATSVVHLYPSGLYTVTLTVYDAGDNGSTTQQIYIGDNIGTQLTGVSDVCTGSTVTYSLNNTAPNFQYTWLASGAEIQSDIHGSTVDVEFTDAGNAVLSVIVSNGAGCDSILQHTITVHETPRLMMPGQTNDTIQTGLTICQNTAVWHHVLSLNSTNGNITWSSGSGTTLSAQGVDSMLFLFPDAGTTYLQIVETTTTGCTDTLLVLVDVTEGPDIAASGLDACLGSENHFVAAVVSGAFSSTYFWRFDDGSEATTPIPSHIFATTGAHTAQLIVTNQYGCNDTAQVTVQVDANAGPPIECVGPVCTGDVVVYSTPVAAGASYHWTITGGTITSGGTLTDNTVGVTWGNSSGGSIELYLTGPGIYCQFPTTEFVQILGGNAPVLGDQTPCQYTIETYSTNIVPGGVYTWTVTGGFIQSGQGTHQIEVYFNSANPVTISVNIAHQILSCSSTGSLSATPLSEFRVYSNNVVCVGVPATFNTYASGSFNWTVENGIIQSGNGTNAVTAYWNAPGVYRVAATNTTDFCNTEAELFVTAIERKHEVIEGKNLVCAGSTETYSISPENNSYTWSALTGGAIFNGANSPAVSITWNTPGAHILRIIYINANGCRDTSFLTVTVAPESIPAITGDTVTCFGNTETYSIAAVSGVNYSWETEGGFITSGQNSPSITAIWVGNQIGLLRLRNTVCNTFVQKNIVIRPTPEVHIKPENLTCDGLSADLRVIEDYTSYLWNTGSTTQTITITTTGIYTVTATDALGCTASGTQNANPIPNNGFSATSILISYPSVPTPYAYVELTAFANPTPVSYLWSTGNQEITQYVSQPGTYTVTVTNEFGCTAEMTAIATNTPGVCYIGTSTCVRLPCPGISPVFTTNSPVCNPVQFTPGVTANFYHWNFDDGVFSTASNATHRFTSPGTKTVYFSYSNDGNTWYECSQTLVITSVMDISFEKANGCQGLAELTNTSTSILPVTSVLWRLGDGNTSSTTPVLNHQYPNTASSYMVTLILEDGTCIDSLEKQVSVHQLNTDFAYGNICKDNPALFNSTTVHTKIISNYAWDFGNTETADYYNPVTYYDATGSYTVSLTIEDEDGCVDAAVHTVTVNAFVPLPVVASGTLTFCKGSSVDLTIPAGYSTYWNTAETTNSIHVTQSGSYYAWMKDNTTGCSGFSDTTAVVVNTPPRALAGNTRSPEMCEGDYLQLRAYPYAGVTWQWYHDGVSVAGQGAYFYAWGVTTAETGDYLVVITDPNGCKDTSNVLHVDVHPLPPYPSITQTPSGSHCDGEPVLLSVTSNDLIQWSNGSTGNSITVYHNSSVQVIATNQFGCATSNYDYISYNPVPDFSYFPEGCYQICENDNITVSGPSAMQTYLWSNGETTQGIQLSVSGSYSMSATTTSGCVGESPSFTVDVFDAGNIQLGNDTFICAGQTLTLDAGAYPTILWQDNSTAQIYTVSDSGLYRVSITNSAGCSSEDSIRVALFSGAVNLGTDTTVCQGSSVLLSVTGNFASILWSDGSTSSSYTVTQAGEYFVEIVAPAGCTARDSIEVSEFPVNLIGLPDVTYLCNATLTLNAGTSFSTYLWNTGESTSVITATDTGTFRVIATDANGCVAEDSIRVLPCDSVQANRCEGEYALPNAFTPNGDGNNDEFKALRNPNSTGSQFFSLRVFNRWGELVFETNNENDTWDGKFRGSDMPAGVSIYTVGYTCEDEYITRQGSVTLLR